MKCCSSCHLGISLHSDQVHLQSIFRELKFLWKKFFFFALSLINMRSKKSKKKFWVHFSDKQKLLLLEKLESGVSMSDIQKYFLSCHIQETSCFARADPRNTCSQQNEFGQCCDEMVYTAMFTWYKLNVQQCSCSINGTYSNVHAVYMERTAMFMQYKWNVQQCSCSINVQSVEVNLLLV